MMNLMLEQLGSALPALTVATTGHEGFPIASQVASGNWWAGFILWLPIISMVLCGACAVLKIHNKTSAAITVILLGGSFLLTLLLYFRYTEPATIYLFEWFRIPLAQGGSGQTFIANFSLYVDRLTLLWMLFVTGLSTLIALYASEYMEGDLKTGYNRFFAGVSVFVFAMSCLVMGDNLVMLYLGWEGVGFASYWLIGYFYHKPSAVAAAKKAFIVNRIGDLGLALGLYLTWHYFGTVQYTEIFAAVKHGVDTQAAEAGGWYVKYIPFLLMLGAFGKSAQIPLYVWLPDAMEGPTPVSALIHAATMVTAGVYLLARMFPLLEALHPLALPAVAWIGGLTALLAATIGMAQFDIKRIMAYSTVSQLGYMFMGIGLMTTHGGGYHVFTHAFFKAVLFLTCGAIMHGFAGQLDLRKVSGLAKMPGWRIVSWTMFYACLCLVGFPLISSGFYSKDMIMAQAFMPDQVHAGYGFFYLGLIGVFTALLTAYYAFRVWFRVCAGPVNYEMGDEHHGDDDHGHGGGHARPHAPRLAINLTLLIITAGGIYSIFLKDWAGGMIEDSTALVAAHHAAEHGGFWSNPHTWMPWVASITTIVGIAIAFYFHLANRQAADNLKNAMLANRLTRWLPTAAENKWYVDEFYHAVIRLPLWIGGHILYGFDKFI
ncbi:MAG: NADH-quinone oxidoreductase subunit L, partial [Phycisphaerales bacterium]